MRFMSVSEPSRSYSSFMFEGKERLRADGINEYDQGARRYAAAFPFFTTPDRKASSTPWLSPYSFCAANPVMNIDPTGNIWKVVFGCEGTPIGFEWIDNKNAYDKEGHLRPYHYEQSIIFSSEGPKGMFDPESFYDIGTSEATVYKADGSTIDFDACTYPSDIEAYATVPEGTYEAMIGKHKGEYTALRVSDVGTTDFNSNSIELGSPNPSNSKTTKAVGVNIHKAGLYNQTKSKSGKPISAACFLIDREKWDEFIGIFDTKEQKNNVVGIILLRP